MGHVGGSLMLLLTTPFQLGLCEEDYAMGPFRDILVAFTISVQLLVCVPVLRTSAGCHCSGEAHGTNLAVGGKLTVDETRLFRRLTCYHSE